MIRVASFVVTAAIGLACAAAAMAQEHVWKMGFIQATDSSYLKMVETIPDRIAKATDGKLKIEPHPTLVKGPQQPAALRDGRLEMTMGVNPWLSGEAPILNIGHLPGLIKSEEEYRRVMDAGLKDDFAKVWADKYNGVMLATGVWEDQVILSNKEIRTAEDFKGLKIRVHNTEAAQLMNALGAKPTPVVYEEIAPSLQRGVVDAVMTSCGTSHGFGFYTVAKYIHVWKIGTAVGWSAVVNKDAWAKLSPDLQKAVAAEFKAIEDDHYKVHKSYSDAMIQKQVDKGMTLIRVSDAEIAKVFSPQNVDAVYEAFYKLAADRGYDGKAVVEKARKIVAQTN
jgi:TRAP-type C4-dicarboxylate transport system substrate-binding protein